MKLAVKYEQKIPLCRSEFLQDVSIELGKRFNPVIRYWPTLSAKCELYDDGDSALERLTIWLEDHYDIGVGLTVSEDHTTWVCLFLRPSPNNPGYQISFYPTCEKFTPSDIARAFSETFSIVTRLCYGDSPEAWLRKFWKHTGKFPIEGELPKSGGTATNESEPSASKKAKK